MDENEKESNAMRFEQPPLGPFRTARPNGVNFQNQAEYMDIKTLWDRTNDAINTIIRRNESAETGEFLQPCIEAARNLGCTTRRTLRSQRNCSPRCYLNPSAQEADCVASYSSFMKHTTVNVARIGTAVQKHVARNRNRATHEFSFPSKNGPLPSDDKCATNMFSVYHLFHGNHLKVEELQHRYGISPNSISNSVEPAETGVVLNISSPDADSSNKMNHTGVRNTSTDQHKFPVIYRCEWNEFSHLTPPIDKSLSSFPRSNGNAPLSSSSNEWSVEGGHMNVDATTLSKQKTVYGPPVDQQFRLLGFGHQGKGRSGGASSTAKDSDNPWRFLFPNFSHYSSSRLHGVLIHRSLYEKNNLSSFGHEAAQQNGVHPQLWVHGDDSGSDDVTGIVEETNEIYLQNGVDDNGATEEATERSNDLVESRGLIDSEKGEIKDNVNQSKPQKVQGKTKNEKPLGPKNVHSALMKKKKDGKGTEGTLTSSNAGSVARNSGPKLPHKNRPLNERQANASKQSKVSDAAFSEGTTI
ncbi:Detected protein of unknown function [Hibiscus syriacus]|uniref:Uncharacterized protein n=1 Tax=Hibiscus syriacus TaxID=106335 RepID=A0A6A3A741_HIBSY|nr:Detected protein of unknown function [Hibiscus syriacus]